MVCVHEGDGYRGQRVGEASHPGPVRRLRRSADVRNVFPRLATQSTVADNDDDRPLVHVLTDVVVPVQAPEVHILSDAEPRAPVRPSRRVALVPEPEDTPQSFQDMHPTSSHGAEQDPCQDTPSVHQGPSPEGRDAAARVGPQLSVNLTHVDSDSASQVDESLPDAWENDLQPRRRRFRRRVHSVSENVAQWGTEGRFAVLSSELEEACSSFEATVPASSNAVRAAHRI